MPTLAVDDILAIYYDGRQDGQQVLLTTHYTVLSVNGTYLDMQTAFDAIDTALEDLEGIAQIYRDTTSVDLIDINIHVQKIWPLRYTRRSYPFAGATPGVAGAAMPANVSAGLTLRGELAIKSDRGTKKIGAVPVAWVENSLLTSTALDEYNILGNVLSANIVIGDTESDGIVLSPIIYHRSSPASSALVTSHVVGSAVRTQRRRTVGLGT